jgi:hypothetical protein
MIAKTYHAPNKMSDEEKIQYADRPKIFLAGSIEMGSAEPWQDELIKRYDSYEVVFFNPRRPDWDSSWSDTSDAFNEQVNWELDHLEMADMIILYFDPETKSPISLLELGLFARDYKIVVCCPDGFWRKGNVRIVCERAKIPLIHNKEKLLESLDLALSSLMEPNTQGL